MKLDQKGSIGSLALMVGMVLLILASVAFGAWAFMSRSDYKNNSDVKVAAAVSKAKSDQKASDETDFAEREKLPYETFAGPSEFGSINLSYPKSWELYVDIKNGGANQNHESTS